MIDQTDSITRPRKGSTHVAMILVKVEAPVPVVGTTAVVVGMTPLEAQDREGGRLA